MNNIISKSARHYARGFSLAVFKANAHRADRAAKRRVISEIVKGTLSVDDADFMPNRRHMVTAWEVS